MQAAQVRKSSYVAHEDEREGTNTYHPETHHSCTVHAGTHVQQASTNSPIAWLKAKEDRLLLHSVCPYALLTA